eukprot:scaffold384119_cov39-Prasinocladus_malaysianus.AAC.1
MTGLPDPVPVDHEESFPSFLDVTDDNNIPALFTIRGPRGAACAQPQAANVGLTLISFWCALPAASVDI